MILRFIKRALLRQRLSVALDEISHWWQRPDARPLQLVHTMNHISDLRAQLAALDRRAAA